MTVSEQKPEKPAKAPSWWIPIVFTVLLTWLVNNAITVFTFIATGVVNLSHVGIGPFLLALGLSVVCGLIGVILGIRLCLYAIFIVIDGIFHQIKQIKFPPDKKPSYQEKASEAKLFDLPEPDPPTHWEAIRYRASEIAGAAFAWLIIPKWPSRPR